MEYPGKDGLCNPKRKRNCFSEMECYQGQHMLSEVGTEQYDNLEDTSHKAKHSGGFGVWGREQRCKMELKVSCK